MIGVLLLALGTSAIFAGFEHGWELDNTAVVLGYVIMRVPLLGLYLRAARANPDRQRPLIIASIGTIVLQTLWVGSLLVHQMNVGWLVAGLSLYAAELALPVVIDRMSGGSPWTSHHLTERFGLLAIIAVGEAVIGTTITLTTPSDS